MSEPVGAAIVRRVFKSGPAGEIAGCFVESGSIGRGDNLAIFREQKEIWVGGIYRLNRFAVDVDSVAKDYECGIVLDGFSGIQEGDRLEVRS